MANEAIITLTKHPQHIEAEARQASDEVDEFFQADRISTEMAAVGGLVLRNFTGDLGPTQAMSAAKRVFSAMRKLEARQLEKEQKHGE